MAIPSERLHILVHPLVEHKLNLMRDPYCSTSKYYQLALEIGMFFGFELTRDVPTILHTFAVPDNTGQAIQGRILTGKKPAIVPILRSGLPLAEGMRMVMSSIRVGHMGFTHDKETYEALEYLITLPDPEGRTFILLDTAIGTGNVASRAVNILKDIGVVGSNIKFASIIATEEGIEKLMKNHPDINIYIISLENNGLNEDRQIRPGIGSSGDRLFGTLNKEDVTS